MTRADVALLRQCVYRAPVHVLPVHPRGFALDAETRLRPRLQARILGYGNARTRYHNREPACRSLDGLRATDHPHPRCAECALRNQCTPQLRLDLIAERRPYRLLLNSRDLQRFLLYHARLQQRGLALEDIVHCIDVINRGSWVELRFHTLAEPTEAPDTPATDSRSTPPQGHRT